MNKDLTFCFADSLIVATQDSFSIQLSVPMLRLVQCALHLCDLRPVNARYCPAKSILSIWPCVTSTKPLQNQVCRQTLPERPPTFHVQDEGLHCMRT